MFILQIQCWFAVFVGVTLFSPVLPSPRERGDQSRTVKRSVFPMRRSMQDCVQSAELRTLCERCAKESRSDSGFIMCCGDEAGIRSWCRDFISFGSNNKHYISNDPWKTY